MCRPPQKSLGALIDAFADLEPELGWRRRQSTIRQPRVTTSTRARETADVGPGGLERRSDLGSCIAPGTPLRYPDHSHPPEETYSSCLKGCSVKRTASVHARGRRLVHNVPMIEHAIVSGDRPLFHSGTWMGPR